MHATYVACTLLFRCTMHKHDTKGMISGPYCVYIGTTIYVYNALHCTCGTLREFKIRGRIHVGD